jgi:geranylgeranyl diphosphate/geranylgeranyl-bacteriochlorophyllide a reductase
MTGVDIFDVAVVGGGPAGATAAEDLARAGFHVALIDRAGRIKPCGGAVPPRLIRDFAIPDSLLVARITSARMISPSGRSVDMPIDNGFVGMVDRETFDEFLRTRAARAGAQRVTGSFDRLTRDRGGVVTLHLDGPDGEGLEVRTRLVIGADGARSKVARQEIPGGGDVACVFAYHEIISSPPDSATYDGKRCEVHYRGTLSPDFYAWVFPHGATVSVGTGSARKGFSLRKSVRGLRDSAGLDGRTLRGEGAPIPLAPLRRWDNGRDVLLAGDAAGVVAPASGEGIYYAMVCGRMAATAAAAFLRTGSVACLKQARRAFMAEHGRVFWILGLMQRIWYRNDRLRERFVKICEDPGVQRLTWEAYMNKALARPRPLEHARIFVKDMAHLLGIASV